MPLEHSSDPLDDGACEHLKNLKVPPIPLLSTSNRFVNIATLTGTTVIYFYPLITPPNATPMPGWEDIPGARGCTAQSCSFRDIYADFSRIGTQVFGVSSQSTETQKEAVARLHLPFELLTDYSMELTQALNLPTLEHNGIKLIKRLTIIIKDGFVVKYFYPVFPPDQNAFNVMQWLLIESTKKF